MKPSNVRAAGVLIALGGIVWFATRVVVGPQPADATHATEIAGGGAFQIGLLAMLLTMRATGATGVGRGGRFVVNAGLIFVALASVWTLVVTMDTSLVDVGPVLVLDVFWPLSMVWLIIVGVAVLRARTWPAPARHLPLAASFVLPVHIVAEVIGLSDWASWTLPIVYVAVAYTALGLAVGLQVAGQAEQNPSAAPRSELAGR
jgi:hypothetical protein